MIILCLGKKKAIDLFVIIKNIYTIPNYSYIKKQYIVNYGMDYVFSLINTTYTVYYKNNLEL